MLESKKECKVLRVALNRIQSEYDRLKEKNLANLSELDFQISLNKQINHVISPVARSIDADGLTFLTKLEDDQYTSLNNRLPSLRSSI